MFAHKKALSGILQEEALNYPDLSALIHIWINIYSLILVIWLMGCNED